MVQSTRAACPWTWSIPKGPGWLQITYLSLKKKWKNVNWGGLSKTPFTAEASEELIRSPWVGLPRCTFVTSRERECDLSLCHNIWHSHLTIWQFRFLKKQYIINCHYFHPIFLEHFDCLEQWLPSAYCSKQYNSVPPKLTESCHTQSLLIMQFF